MHKEDQVSIKYLQHGMQLKDFLFFPQGKNCTELGAKPVAVTNRYSFATTAERERAGAQNIDEGMTKRVVFCIKLGEV